ncbi:MAG: hypothetical protein R3E58_02760 [Phycisphaerae bacterium]
MESAACELEITTFADFLNKCGARIEGQMPRIVVEGVASLHGAEHTIIPDRIEAGTFMIAAAVSNGELTLKDCRIDHLCGVCRYTSPRWFEHRKTDKGVNVSSSRRLDPTEITTQPYPGFDGLAKPQTMVLLSLADGNSVVTEKIFPDRFLHVAELNRMGTRLARKARPSLSKASRNSSGAPVMAPTVRQPRWCSRAQLGYGQTLAPHVPSRPRL